MRYRVNQTTAMFKNDTVITLQKNTIVTISKASNNKQWLETKNVKVVIDDEFIDKYLTEIKEGAN